MLSHPSDDGLPMKFPSHSDTLFLDSVRPKDVPRGKFALDRESLSLRTWDIEGSAPKKAFKPLAPPKLPIDKTAPTPLYPPLSDRRPRDLSLTTSDVELAQPKAKQFTTPRYMDPLTPRYNLPTSVPLPHTPPGVRMHEGRPWESSSLVFKGEHTPRVLERSYARDPNDHADIEGTRARLRPFAPRDTLRTFEHAGDRILSTKCHTPRETSPLDPVYNVPTGTTHPFRRSEAPSRASPAQVGVVEGSTSRVLHKDNGEPQASLIRADIPGAVPQRYKGVMPFNIYDPPEVTPYSKHTGLQCRDIEGATTGSRSASER